jgi:hypothetical protein
VRARSCVCVCAREGVCVHVCLSVCRAHRFSARVPRAGATVRCRHASRTFGKGCACTSPYSLRRADSKRNAVQRTPCSRPALHHATWRRAARGGQHCLCEPCLAQWPMCPQRWPGASVQISRILSHALRAECAGFEVAPPRPCEQGAMGSSSSNPGYYTMGYYVVLCKLGTLGTAVRRLAAPARYAPLPRIHVCVCVLYARGACRGTTLRCCAVTVLLLLLLSVVCCSVLPVCPSARTVCACILHVAARVRVRLCVRVRA